MATTTPSAALVPIAPVFTSTERPALAGFLAGYSGLTRQAYELDLRQFASWCEQHKLALFGARRADIELFARDMEARGRARATITRRLCTVAGFYRYASKRSCSITRLRRMCAVPGWTMSRTRSAWTETSLARYWSLLALGHPWSMRSSRCWR
jgi:hypothetical protein